MIHSYSLEYILSIDQLEKEALANLGDMDECPYKDFLTRMNKVAADAGITKVILAVGFKDKNFCESVLSIEEHEWEEVKSASLEACAVKPRVFVIDGSKFTVYALS